MSTYLFLRSKAPEIIKNNGIPILARDKTEIATFQFVRFVANWFDTCQNKINIMANARKISRYTYRFSNLYILHIPNNRCFNLY